MRAVLGAKVASRPGRVAIALLIGACTALTSSGVASASVTKNLSVTHAKETDKKWCVAASVWMELKQIGQSPPSQSTLYNQGLRYKRCNVGVDSGLDPLAWAWLLYLNTGPGYYYDDYTYTTAYSGTINLASQLYSYGEVGGALVNEGHHAMVFKGATTSCNLDLDSCWMSGPTISTIYVDDPWYNWNVNTPGKDADGCPGTGGTYTCGKIGLAPNTAIAYSTWTAYYYTKWGHQNCAYWDGKFVSVLRKATSGGPSIPVQGGAKDPSLAPTPDPTPGLEYPTPPGQDAALLATSADVSALDATFQTAKKTNGLKDRSELAASLDGGHITRTSFVHSLVTTFPDYLLATVVGRHGLRGVAMFTLEDPSHPEFAGMTYADGALSQFPLVSAADSKKLLAEKGVKATGDPQLVWGWSSSTNSPYYPMWKVATMAGSRYVTSTGQVIVNPDLQAPARG